MRTINRPPASVGIPDVDYKYFNHYNWKGLNTNKNYYDLDPETFESAENIYVDEKGILKSRPSLHPLDKNLTNIIKSWSFEHVQVYLTDEDNEYKLHFIDGVSTVIEDVTTLNVLLSYNNNKIFIFDNEFKYYDLLTKSCANADEFKYVPITKTITNGVIDAFESPNLFCNQEIHEYIYDSKSNVSFSQLFNYKVTIKTDTYSKTVPLFTQDYTNLLFIKRYIDISMFESPLYHDSYNIQSSILQYPLYRPLISVSDSNRYIFCKATRQNGLYNQFYYNYDVYYSVNGELLMQLPTIKDCIIEPKITLDGRHVCAIKRDGVYVFSLSESDESDETSNILSNLWTKVYEFERHIPLHFSDENSDEYPRNDFNYAINAIFFTVSDYLIFYGHNFDINKDDGLWPTKISVIQNINGSVSESEIINSITLAPIRFHIDAKKHNNNEFSFGLHYTILNNRTYINRCLLNHSTEQAHIVFDTKSAIIFIDEQNQSNNNYYAYYFDNEHNLRMYVYNSDYSRLIRVSEYFLYAYHTFSNNIVILSNLFELDNELYKNEFIYISDILSNAHVKFDSSDYEIDSANQTIYIIGVNNHLHVCMHNSLYNNVLDKSISLLKYVSSRSARFRITALARSNNHYFASFNNKLYINEIRHDDNNNFQFYFPENNTKIFNDNISAITTLSDVQTAIFLPNEIWYTENTENGITINKSKIALGCNIGDDVISSFDGKYTIFPSKRGLVALSYQDFVASTDQTITYLSDAILPEFVEFRNNGAVKMFLYKYWLFCYHNTDGQIYILDFRNNSWWYWQLPSAVLDVAEINDEPELIINGQCYGFDHGSENYFDYILENKIPINWHLTSQKLNLGTLNNYKHIINLTLNAIQESDDPMYLTLSLANYRDTATKIDGKVLEYQVDVLKTFVKRLNYYKVNHFQYKLENTNNIALQIPLSIDNVSIKYKVTGQVR